VDTLTHALSGALLARATARQPSASTLPLGRRVLIGGLAAAFPDLDFVTGYVSPVFYIQHHRGITHSLLLMPLWALLIAYVCSLAWRRDRDWRAYYGVAAMGVALHILGDLITSYGTMIFAPVSNARYAWDTTFIIDLWFSGILLAGLLVSWAWRRSRVPAAAGLVILATYVGWQATLRHVAVEFGPGLCAGGWIEGGARDGPAAAGFPAQLDGIRRGG
jgi:inner membrane protein